MLSCVEPGGIIFTHKEVSDLWFDLDGVRIYMLPVPVTAVGVFTVKDVDVVVCDVDFPVEHISVRREFFDENLIMKIREEKERIRNVYARRTQKKWDGNFILPVRNYKRIKNNFGARREINGRFTGFHRGIDISAKPGTKVLASNSGEIVLAGKFVLEGNLVIIDHGSGIFSIYAHLKKILVKEGEMVRKGQIIGEIGRTGRATGPHLHFGIKVGEVDINPFFMFEISKKIREFFISFFIPGKHHVFFSS